MSTISEMLIKIGADSTNFNNELVKTHKQLEKSFDPNPVNQLTKAMDGTSSAVGTLISRFGGMAALAAGGFGLKTLISGAVQAGENVYQLQNRLHITASEAVQMGRIMALTGGDIDTASSALMRLDKNLNSHSADGQKAAATLAAVGVSVADSNGKLLPLNEQLRQLATGYQKASAAGYGQEYLMNTLGVRGLALAKTLQNYNEAAANAQRIKGIGLDPEEMHKVSQELQVAAMQADALKQAGGAALAPLAMEFLPTIINGLAATAQWLAQNKAEVSSLAKTGLELVAVYKAVQAAKAVGTAFSTLSIGSSAGSAVADDALTASQEKSIARRLKMIEASGQAEIKQYQRTAEFKAFTEEQKTAAVTAKSIEIEKRISILAEEEQAKMISAYQKINAAAAASAESQSASLSTVGAAAEVNAAKISAANASTAGSTETIIAANATAAASEATKGAAAAEAGLVQKTSNASAAESAAISAKANATVAESEIAKGAAATEAGSATVKANIAATDSAAALAAANTGAGASATAAGLATVKSAGAAGGAVSKLTSLVWTLAGGWLGVAAAIGYAFVKLVEYQKAKSDQRQDSTYSYNGQNYVKKDGKFYLQGVPDVTGVDSTSDYLAAQDAAQTEVTDNAIEDVLLAKEKERQESHMSAAEKALKAAEEKANNQDTDLQSRIAAAMSGIGKTGTSSGSTLGKSMTATTPKTYKIEVPIGEEVLAQARARIGTPYQLGGAGDDLGNISTDCGKLVLDSFKAAGVQFSSRIVPDMIREAGSAYHTAGSGYIPQAGDAAVVLGDNHIVVSNGQGGYVGANSSTGVQEHNSITHDFGPVSGYISVSELTGGRTIAKTVTEDGKLASEAITKLNKAKTDYYNLNAAFTDEINKNSSEYAASMTQTMRDFATKNFDINKLAAAGLDTTNLKTKFEEYKKVITDSVTDKWHQAVNSIRTDTKKTLALVQDDYKAAANAEYEATITKLDAERKEKLKSIALYKGDLRAQLLVDEWYNSQAEAAAKQKEQNIREAHQKTLEAMEDKGDLAGIKAELKNNPQDRQADLDLEKNKTLSKEYVKYWDIAHRSIQADIAESSSTLYSSLTDSIKGFINGTNSAIDIAKNFGSTVLQMFAQIAAQKAAASIMGGIFGGMGMAGGMGAAAAGTAAAGGFSAGMYSSTAAAMGITFGAFADGGIVTAPTLALIGEVPGQKEAVIPLTDNNLRTMSSGRSSGSTIVNNFSVKDANSFKQSQAQISAALAGAVARGRRFA